MFFLRSFCGKYLDVYEGSTDDGTPIIQWEFNGNTNQKWIIIPSDEEEENMFNPHQDYIITSALDRNLALDISQDPNNEGQMIIWDRHG